MRIAQLRRMLSPSLRISLSLSRSVHCVQLFLLEKYEFEMHLTFRALTSLGNLAAAAAVDVLENHTVINCFPSHTHMHMTHTHIHEHAFLSKQKRISLFNYFHSNFI